MVYDFLIKSDIRETVTKSTRIAHAIKHVHFMFAFIPSQNKLPRSQRNVEICF